MRGPRRISNWGVCAAEVLPGRVQAVLRSVTSKSSRIRTIKVARLDAKTCSEVHCRKGAVRTVFEIIYTTVADPPLSHSLSFNHRKEVGRGSSSAVVMDTKRPPGPFVPSSDNDVGSDANLEESEDDDSDSEDEIIG